jgi:hypothetical protein
LALAHETQPGAKHLLAIYLPMKHDGNVYAGNESALLAVREIEPGKYLVVAYRELSADGFISTAFLTRRFQSLARRQLVWSPQN